MNQQELLPVLKPIQKPRRLIVGYASTDTPGVDVPCLRIRGRWLQDAGFVIGRHVTIEISEGRLTIAQGDR
jgi:toxic protein SymE